METSVSALNNKINITNLSDKLLAGLYASGYTNLEEINHELYNIILNNQKVFAKIDYSSEIKIKTLVSSILQSLINDSSKKVLIVLSDEVEVDNYVGIFKKVSAFVDEVNVSSLFNMTDNDNIIISESKSISNETVIDDLNYIIIDDSVNKHLSVNLNFTDINKAILCKHVDEEIMSYVRQITEEVEVVEKTITKEEITEESVVEESVVEEAVVEESVAVEAVVEEAVAVEAVVEEAVVEEAVAVETVVEEAVVEEAVAVETVVEEAVAVETVVEEAVVEETVVEEAVVEESESQQKDRLSKARLKANRRLLRALR
jgi:hypothetical protein